MTRNRSRIAIIGGGLSGLYAAYLLELRGFANYQIFEARSRLGGRIDGFKLSWRRTCQTQTRARDLILVLLGIGHKCSPHLRK